MLLERDQWRFAGALAVSVLLHLPVFWLSSSKPKARAEIAIVEGEVSIAGSLVAPSAIRPPPPPLPERPLEVLSSPQGEREAFWPKPAEPEPPPPEPEPLPEPPPPDPEPPPPEPQPEPEPEPEPQPEARPEPDAKPEESPADANAASSADADAAANPQPNTDPNEAASSGPVGARTRSGAGAVPLTSPQPPMPERARDRGIEGQVHLTLTIDTEGRITAIEVTRSSGHRWLDNHTTRFIQENWRYRPAMVDGVPVEAEAPVIVDYKLRRR